MSEYLKGNYELPKKAGHPPAPANASASAPDDASAQEDFERRAMERLGGSIAFVMKPKTFVWKGADSGDSRSTST